MYDIFKRHFHSKIRAEHGKLFTDWYLSNVILVYADYFRK